MQPITNQAEQTIAYQQQRLSPYIALVLKALVKTYGLPFFGAYVANLLMNLLYLVIPEIFSGILGGWISLGAFLVVLVYGWRFAENRWHGRELFSVYAAIGKTRRLLETEIKADTPSDAVIQHTMSDYVKSADHFIETAKTYHLNLDVIEVD